MSQRATAPLKNRSNTFFPFIPSSDSEPVVSEINFDQCISERGYASINVEAEDPKGGELSFFWEPLDGGEIIGDGPSVTFDPPDTGPHACPYRIKVTAVSSTSGLSAEETIEIYVKLAGDVNW